MLRGVRTLLTLLVVLAVASFSGCIAEPTGGGDPFSIPPGGRIDSGLDPWSGDAAGTPGVLATPSPSPSATPTATRERPAFVPPTYEDYPGPAVTTEVRVFRPSGRYEDRGELATCQPGGEGRLDYFACTPALGLRGGCYAAMPPDGTVLCDADPFEAPGGRVRRLLQPLPNEPVIPDVSALAALRSEPQWVELANGARCARKLGGTRYLVFLEPIVPTPSSYFCAAPSGIAGAPGGYPIDLTFRDGPVIRQVNGAWVVDLAIRLDTPTSMGTRVIRNVPVAVIWR